MSQVYDALRRMELERQSPGNVAPEQTQPLEFLQRVVPEPVDLSGAQSVNENFSVASRLVALTDPKGLGAEKFRALATRLEHLRSHRELKSLQITSSLAHEGKSLVTTNLAVTFARNHASKILLVEGDLHRPTLTSFLGLTDVRGLSHWWSGRDQEISRYIYRFGRMPLWLLPAGTAWDQPFSILQSVRFAEALSRLITAFDWVLVDSTPLLPFADANLWSRLLDGMLLVVREGVASVKALKKGLDAIDNLNLVGVILNDTPDLDQTNYEDHYYALPKQWK
jgi:capsular exopolysaccharide synthesis family protein